MKQLSPWKMVDHEMIGISGREYNVYSIVGVTTLDYLELYKKFTYVNRESYRLDFIGEVELGQKKLDHSEFDTFKDFYKGNWKKFIDYNIKDVELVDRLEDKMKLIELVITMAFDAKVNFIDPMCFIKSACGIPLSTTISRRETLLFHLRTGLRRMTSSLEHMSKNLNQVSMTMLFPLT